MDHALFDMSNLNLVPRPSPIKTTPVSVPSTSNAPMHEPAYRQRALTDYVSNLNVRIQGVRSRLLTLRPLDTIDREFVKEAVLETAERYGIERVRVPRAVGLEEAGFDVGNRREFYQARLREHNQKIAYTRAALELELEELQNVRDQVLTEMYAYTKSR